MFGKELSNFSSHIFGFRILQILVYKYSNLIPSYKICSVFLTIGDFLTSTNSGVLILEDK